jgi:hypothetical protein
MRRRSLCGLLFATAIAAANVAGCGDDPATSARSCAGAGDATPTPQRPVIVAPSSDPDALILARIRAHIAEAENAFAMGNDALAVGHYMKAREVAADLSEARRRAAIADADARIANVRRETAEVYIAEGDHRWDMGDPSGAAEQYGLARDLALLLPEDERSALVERIREKASRPASRSD